MTAGPGRHGGVEDLLSAARAGLSRLTVAEAVTALAEGARMVDIRPAWQRAGEGEIAGSLIVERNHLEWRLHPDSEARVELARPGQRWIVVCGEGYTSSLAAASLCSIGVEATDLIGGVHAWRDEGLPLIAGPSQVEQLAGTAPAAAGELERGRIALAPPAPRPPK
jgi:rhodanese-related sulfurtransferase